MHRAVPAALSFACAIAAFAAPASAQIGHLGAMGDSLTDEYFEDTWTYASNWTMQLVQYRGVNMGPTAAQAAQPGNTWGEPRRAGYQNNWARYGDDTTTAISDGQHTGLASQVGPASAGGVTHVFIEIGTNDFSPQTSAFFDIYLGLWNQTKINNYINTSLANLENIVTTLDNTGAAIVMANAVDFGVPPAARDAYTNASRRDKVSAAVAQLDAGIELIAKEHHAVLLDTHALATAILGTNDSLKQFLAIGNVNIQLFNRDTTTHTNPLAGFVDDGAHPHTTLQGVFANAIMAAFNQGWGTSLQLFSDSEILAHAGIAYGGADTLDAAIGPYSQYIRSYRCPGDTNRSGAVDSADLAAVLTHYGEASGPGLPNAAADINHDGVVDTLDLGILLGAFGTSCN